MTYFKRSVKYFFALCVICMAVMALNLLAGTSALSFGDTIYAMFHTSRFAMLYGAVVVLALLYPKFGFTVRRIEGSVVENRRQIVNAFLAAGFSLRSETDGVMTFRADGIVQKIMLLGEDEIQVFQSGPCIVLDGIRRGVAKVAYRLDGYIQMSKND